MDGLGEPQRGLLGKRRYANGKRRLRYISSSLFANPWPQATEQLPKSLAITLSGCLHQGLDRIVVCVYGHQYEYTALAYEVDEKVFGSQKPENCRR